ncbi:MAG: DUF4338 domain-containing protein [Acidobacteria bacterium]|nr:DUF4338 domain-containing protein [Acidobacteriota bacterium]
MSETLVVQGRRLEPADLALIRGLIAEHSGWSRRRLSEAVSAQWDWRSGSGRLKDMAARSLLLKLQARGLIELPPRRQQPSNRMAGRRLLHQEWDSTPLGGSLREAGPLTVREISQDRAGRNRCAAALSEFHYLGCRGTVGENLHYAVTNPAGRLLACLVFGSAAWKCRVRDEFIGWARPARERNLHLLANNHRFLILPFVKIPHLASWILGQILGRLSQDWQEKYGHRIVLVETFVERDRFRGTSYRAANWVRLGTTTGRSRQDREHTLRLPIKEVYLYPLRRGFRQELAR